MREFIVGGVAYPLIPWLITPYEINGLSSSMSANFNAWHEVARLLAMRAFLQLQDSWRILNKVMWRPDKRKLPFWCVLYFIILSLTVEISCILMLPYLVTMTWVMESNAVSRLIQQAKPCGKT